MSHSDLYRKTADIIEAEPAKWCQGAMSGPDGAHCIMGWLSNLAYDHHAYARAVAVLRIYLPDDFGYLVFYNDAEDRTPEDIVAFLRHVADAEDRP